MHPFHLYITSLIIETPFQGEICLHKAMLTQAKLENAKQQLEDARKRLERIQEALKRRQKPQQPNRNMQKRSPYPPL